MSKELGQRYAAALGPLEVPGLPMGRVSPLARPGVVSLADAAQSAPDFTLLRTTRQSLDELLASYDLQLLGDASREIHAWLTTDRSVLFVQSVPQPPVLAQARLQGYDRHGRLRIELGFANSADSRVHYRQRAATERVDGLQLLRVWESAADGSLAERDLRANPVWLKGV